MGITRSLLQWCDKRLDEALHEDDVRKSHKKISACGVVEFFMDAAILLHVPLMIAYHVRKTRANNK